MPKYRVVMTWTTTAVVELDVDREEEAEEMMCEGMDRPGYNGCKPEQDGTWSAFDFRDQLQKRVGDGWEDVD